MKNFDDLINIILTTHSHLQNLSINTINRNLTIRNWLIGFYIIEFEQKGKDRAQYGKNLIKNLADNLNIKGLTAPELSRCRQFYNCYPHILGALTQEYNKILPKSIFGSLPQELKTKTLSKVSPITIINKLSYTHLVELIKISDDLKRTFYEIECIKGTWSVRELKRQISSLYYERSGLSTKPEKLSELTQLKTKPQNPIDIIKNIYAFEFLNINNKEIIEETDLETALIDNLQNFIIELGYGFCLEARQKKILIGNNYYFIDLLFYHRILKCHVIIEIKIGKFSYGDIGQLNTYLNYFKEEISEENDNDPVGILLVADKDQTLVKYATANMDKNLFVQQYLINLPSKELLEKYIEGELKKIT